MLPWSQSATAVPAETLNCALRLGDSQVERDTPMDSTTSANRWSKALAPCELQGSSGRAEARAGFHWQRCT